MSDHEAEDSASEHPLPVEHDPTGLGLAKSIAESLGAQARRRRHQPQRRTSSEPQASGAHPDDRDPQTLATSLNRLVESKGWSTEISVHTLLVRWPALVGPANAAHSTPVSYRDAVLTVRADSTVWASSLRSMAPQLVAILNDKLGDGTVARVLVQGPDAPSWKKGRLSVRGGRGPRDTYG
ncbi:MAG TPA: DciA family protein [Propionibacteriaceae bacterium]|nr:DciA family protein [Propionibacteriaceae bacterium]